MPNPSFEDTTNCVGFPLYNNSFPCFSPNLATPDYYSSLNTCGYDRLYAGIINGTGFQLPMSGDAFAGLYLYLPGNPFPTREYIEVSLIDTLKANKDYLVNFFVTRANKFGMAVDAVGAYISNNPILNQINASPFPFQPQIENPPGNLLIDSLNWTLVSGIYSAVGGEKYMTIGNFYDDATTGKMIVDSSIDVSNNGYYYIDDVSIIELNTSSLINLMPYNPLIRTIFSNDESAQLHFQNSDIGNNYKIYNSIGELILNGAIVNSIANILLNNYSKGLYFLEWVSKRKIYLIKFIIQ